MFGAEVTTVGCTIGFCKSRTTSCTVLEKKLKENNEEKKGNAGQQKGKET